MTYWQGGGRGPTILGRAAVLLVAVGTILLATAVATHFDTTAVWTPPIAKPTPIVATIDPTPATPWATATLAPATAAPTPAPTPVPTAAPTAVPTSVPTAAPTASPQDYSVVPTLTVTGAQFAGWTAAQCTRMEGLLAEDASLDKEDEVDFPQYATYYAGTAAKWLTIEQDTESTCQGEEAQNSYPGIPMCTYVLNGLEAGLYTHLQDLNSSDPENSAAWDETWINNYTWMIDLWDEGPAAPCTGVS